MVGSCVGYRDKDKWVDCHGATMKIKPDHIWIYLNVIGKIPVED